MSNYLSPNFLNEILKLCFSKKNFLEIVVTHLKYQYIPKELQEYKFILQSISNQRELSNGKLPSYGVISQQYKNDVDVQDALAKIKQCDIIDQDIAIKQLYNYIRDVRFRLLFEGVYETYDKDQKKDEAIQMLIEGTDELAKFSLQDTKGQFMKVFGDFDRQMHERQLESSVGQDFMNKVPFGIDPLDILTDGGMDKGDIALWIMQSGKGKSTAVKHTGIHACRLGYRVLHIQLEGSKKEAYDKYTQAWTGASYSDVKWGNIPAEKMVKIQKAVKEMAQKNRDIEIFSFEKFGSASMNDIRDLVIEYQKVEGMFPDLLIIDSLDLAISGTNKKIDFDPAYKKDRLQLVAQLGKNLAVELNMAILFVTQTSDIPKANWNNPDWVITRENTEGDRTLVKPFAHVFTGNQTEDERKKNILRIHVDKLRYYDVKTKTYPIITAYNVGKFYDKKASMEKYGDQYES